MNVFFFYSIFFFLRIYFEEEKNVAVRRVRIKLHSFGLLRFFEIYENVSFELAAYRRGRDE